MIKVYEISKDKVEDVKALLEAPEKEKENPFKRQGYLLRDARALGLEGERFYLYIKADEAFFEKNEKVLIDAGAKLLEGEELEKIKGLIEEAEEAAGQAFGSLWS